jgi:hypothetical protein
MPYSWDAQQDFDADAGAAYSFHDARKSYDDVAVAKTSAQAFYTYRSDFLKTDASHPIVIGIDTTGSMEEWPAIFFEKLPLLYREAVKYFPDCEISFQAINDFHADGEDVALQPAPFGKGPQLDELIGQLYPCGGGGGQVMESYEIFAAYNSFLQAPQATIKPIAIILGDEAPFDEVPPAVCRHYRLSTGEAVSSRVVFEKLHQKCDVFLVRKPYYEFGPRDEPIVAKWRKLALMPAERILGIQDPRRVVDVILGVLGIWAGKASLFEEELVQRQDPAQVQEVLGSLHTLKLSRHQPDMSQRSVSVGAKGGAKTRRLDLDA